MTKILILLLTILIAAGCQTSGGGPTAGGIISGHTVVDNKFTLTTPQNVTYLAGQTIPFTLTFPIPITVSGSPRLTVTIGSTVVNADFVSYSGDTMTFNYVVQSSDFDNNGISVSSVMNKNGGSVLYQGTNETSDVIIVPSLSTVQVNGPAGAAPVANNITPPAFNEDTASTITLSYTDADGDPATSCTVGGLNKVTVTTACACAAGVCTVGVTGATNQNGAAFFTYTVTSAGQTSNTATANFTITPVADAPVASNISSTFNEDTVKTLTLSYSDGEGDLAVSCTTSALTNVTVTTPCACASGVCTVSVQGTANYSGAASFGYTVTANGQTSNTATANLTITPVNDAPVAAVITPPAFNEDVQSIITLSYTDTEADPATACTLSALTNVTVSQACACAAGVCMVGVKGTTNYNGAASFNYTVTAGAQVSNSAGATLSITPVDDAPVAVNITPAASVPKDTQTILTLSYTDVESDQATTCSTSNLLHVTVSQACACAAGVCTVGVTGTSGYTGPAGFDYTVTANGLPSNTANASFGISGGTPPVANNITPSAFNEDIQSVITLSYSDVDGDQAATCTTSALSHITVTQACACAAGVCTVGVTGTANYNGAAGFSYTVTAASDVSNTATATLSLTAVDDAPVATNISTPATVQKNQQGIFTLAYTDVENDQATTCSLSGLTNVTVTQACACAAGVCTVGVTGTPAYTGAASFNYTVTANSATSNSASASFTIISSPPVANDITPPAFNEDTQSVITLSYSDADGDLGTSCLILSPTNVTVTQACACAAGVCTVGVTGTANYNGAGASFNYKVTAGGNQSNSALATLSITAVDDAPVATNITPASFAKNIQSVMTLSYTDVENDQATTCSISSPSNVTVTQACSCSAGICTVGVTGTAGYSGAAGFSYTVTSNSLTSNTATSTFTITNTAPVATNVNPGVFNEDTQKVVTLSYSDADGDQASTCSTASLTNVTVTQACACAAGICTVGVTGTVDYNGSASFTFTVTAAGQTSNSATANLSITAVDDKPTGVPLTPAAFNEDTQSIISLTYSDVEGDQAGSCSVAALTNVTVTQACACTLGACTVGVTGTANYSGTGSFTYTVTANGQTSIAQTASLTITSVMDAPTTANLTPAAFNEDTQSIITLTYTAVGGDQATTCALTSPTNVTVTQACACAAGTCTVGVTGTANYNGAASFQWTVSAGAAQSTSRNAAITINAVDDAATLGAMSNQTIAPNANTGALAFTFNDPDGAVCTTARLSMSSTNTTLLPNANVVFAGTAPNCTATITPATNQTGTSNITITATDGGLASKTTTFTLTVSGPILIWTNTSNVEITSFDFGTPGANATQVVRVRNIGNVTTGTITITDPGVTPRIDQTNSCTTLTAGSTCDVTLAWTQTGGGGNGAKTEVFTASATGTSSNFTVTGFR